MIKDDFKDFILVTADSVRADYVDSMDFISSLDVKTAHSASHYTRPSLASILSPRLESVIETRPVAPLIPQVLQEEGYHCIGLTTSPQADPDFNFDRGFDDYRVFAQSNVRGTKFREFVSQYELFQRTFDRFFPRVKRREGLPSDREIIQKAIELFNDSPPPKFLWVHLMETHRPYNLANSPLQHKVDHKARFSPKRVTEQEHEGIKEKYRESLSNADKLVKRLHDDLDSKGDSVFIFTSDHGEGLGENGYYFHPPHLKKLDEEIVRVPLGCNKELFEEEGSLLDIGPTVFDSLGIESPDAWDGISHLAQKPNHTISIAPWGGEAKVLFTYPDKKIALRTDDLELIKKSKRRLGKVEVGPELEGRLRDLGYLGGG